MKKIMEQLKEELVLRGITEETAETVAQIAVENGWRKEKRGVWKKDDSYRGQSKEIFVCSCCGHWQSAKKRDDKIFYMRHCPYCGARLTDES